MSHDKEPKVVHTPGEFQLNPDDFKTGNFVVDGAEKAVVHGINEADFNHDGKSDIAQFAPYVIKALPILQAIAPLVHPEKFEEWLLAHDWIIDKDAAKAALAGLVTLAADAAKLAPKA